MLGSEIINKLNLLHPFKRKYASPERPPNAVLISKVRPEVDYEIDHLWERMLKDDTGWLMQEIIYYNFKVDRANERMRDLC